MNKNIPEVRFEGYSEEWQPINLSELMDFSNGINAPKESYGKGRKMISIMDILDESYLKYENIRSSVEVSPSIEEKNKVEHGDLIFVRSSEVSEEVGWSKAYLDKEYALYSGFSIRGKKKGSFNPFFVELSLNYINRKQIERKAGGSTRFNISQTILKTIEISKPSNEEQYKIGDFFKQLDDTIALQQQLVEQQQQYKKAMLQKMFPQKGECVPKVRFKGFTGDFEKVVMRNLLQKNSERNKDQVYSYVESVSNRYGFVKQDEYFEDRNIASKDTSNYYIIRNKAFAYNPSRINVGSIAFKDKDKISIVSPLYVSFYTKEILDDLYLWYWFKTSEFNRQRQLMTAGGVRDTLSFESLNQINISLISIEEQRKIGAFFKNLDDTIALHQQKIKNYQQLKKALLQRMFV